MEQKPPSSPCVRVCAVSGLTGLCIGCGRTLKEIAAWGRFSEAERLAIMAGLEERKRRAAAAPAESGPCAI